MKNKWKYYFGIFSIIVLVFSSCEKDEADTVPQRSIEERDTEDAGSIPVFLENFYFDSLGRVTQFDDDDPSDDDETPLSDIATELPSGVYYIINDNVPANGPNISYDQIENKEMLMQYNIYTYTSGFDETEDTYLVSFFSLDSNRSTTTTIGLPIWNPLFYNVSEADAANVDVAYYEMPGFREAIPYFHSTETDADTPFVFQGCIVIPSKENYSNNQNYYGIYNQVVIINFQIYQIRDFE